MREVCVRILDNYQFDEHVMEIEGVQDFEYDIRTHEFNLGFNQLITSLHYSNTRVLLIVDCVNIIPRCTLSNMIQHSPHVHLFFR
mgnify:FL=1